MDPLLQLLIGVALALLFAGAAMQKRSEPARFRAQLGAYRILPSAYVKPSATALPSIELGLALLLVPEPTRAFAGVAAAALLLAYASGIGLNLLRGRADIDCGCGGRTQPLSWYLVGRNLTLALVALLLAVPATERPLAIADLLWLALLIPPPVLAYAALGEVLRNGALLRPDSARSA